MKLILRALTALILVGAFIATGVPANAAAGCNSSNFNIGLWSGGEKIAVLHEAATRCWDSTDHLTTGTKVNGVSVNNTILGDLYGFHSSHIGPYVTNKDKYTWDYRTDFTMKPCLAYYLMLCGHTATWSASVTLVQPRYVDAYYGRYLWGIPFCTNDWCNGHLNFGN